MRDARHVEGASTAWARLAADGIVVCDGAMGTMLHAAGVPLDRSLAELNLSRPELVRDLHLAYARAGAKVLQTNTFSANRLRLARFGLQDAVSQLNIAGARLARDAAREAERAVVVAGSVGPATVTSPTPRGPDGARVEALREQIGVLADWVDLLVLETFGDLESLLEAIAIARAESSLPVIAQLTFGDDGRTLRGEEPAAVALALDHEDLAAIGANCTVGPAVLQDVVAELVRGGRTPVSVQPNAGVPRRLGDQVHYARNASYFGRAAKEFVRRGAAIVGGCCGTTPAHVREIAAAVADLAPARPRRPEPAARRSAPITLTDGHRAPPADWPAPGALLVGVGLTPPRGGDLAEFLAQAGQLRASGADVLAITEPAPPAFRVNPIGAAVILHERTGAEVVFPVEAADRSLGALQADLLGAHALGLRTVVCRTGAPRVSGDYPTAWAPGAVDAVQLIATLRGLNEGVDWRGIATTDPTSFVVGGAISAAAEDVARELDRAEQKVAAGARFLVTDVLYDPEQGAALLSGLRGRGVTVPVIAAIAPFATPQTLEGLSNEVPGLSIPAAAVEAAKSAMERPEEAVARAVAMVAALAETVAGVIVHVLPTSTGPAVELIDRLTRIQVGL